MNKNAKKYINSLNRFLKKSATKVTAKIKKIYQKTKKYEKKMNVCFSLLLSDDLSL